jgi:periplasmic protein TonB
MSSPVHSAGTFLGLADRRARTRTLVNPPIYVDLGHINGALVDNMSEHGLALSAAIILAGDDLTAMRIQLPDPEGCIEARGRVAWKSASRKTAGIKFIGLSEGARQRIRTWLAGETSQGKSGNELEVIPNPQRTPPVSLPNPLDTRDVPEMRIPEPVLHTNSPGSLAQAGVIIEEGFPKSAQVQTPNLVDSDNSSRLRERRVHPRKQIRLLRYIQLGQDNGGMLLNISQGGFALSTAMPLAAADLSSIRIQFAAPGNWIEVSGQAAWMTESRRKAGLQFTNLKEEARMKIDALIFQGELPNKLPAQPVNPPDGTITQPELQESSKREILAPVDVPSSRAVQEQWQASAPSRLAVFGMRGDETQAAGAAASEALARKFPKRLEFTPKSTRALRTAESGADTEKFRRVAVIVILAGVTALASGWFPTQPSLRNESKLPVLKKFVPTNTTLTTGVPALRSENSGLPAHDLQPASTGRGAIDSETPMAPVSPQTQIASPATKSIDSGTVPHADSAIPKTQPAMTLGRPALALAAPKPTAGNARSRVVESSPAQRENAPPLKLKRSIAPAASTWSVVVSTHRYPSIRIPAEISSEKASRERSLQIGRVIKRVEPTYPEEAKRQGLDGEVKLHVVVGRDGTMQSVALVSGPAVLGKAAASAVRKWRYSQTLLGGQPIETEQDIVVKFRLVGSSVSKN